MSNINLVIIGNVAYDIDTYPKINRTIKKNGGAGYYTLIGASLYTKSAIVARIGNDFDTSVLNQFENIDVKGLKLIENSPTTKFHHTILSDDGQNRTFEAETYDDTMIRPEDIPEEYFDVKYIHIATNTPQMQKQFIDLIRRKNPKAIISIDTHEVYYESDPDLLKDIFDSVDIAFIDKEFTRITGMQSTGKNNKIGKTRL